MKSLDSAAQKLREQRIKHCKL